METRRVSNQILVLWIPLIAMIVSIVLVMNDEIEKAFALLLIALSLDGFVNLRLLGSSLEVDIFYRNILKTSIDISFRILYSSIIVFIFIHLFYIELSGEFILLRLLLITYMATTVTTLILYFMKRRA